MQARLLFLMWCHLAGQWNKYVDLGTQGEMHIQMNI